MLNRTTSDHHLHGLDHLRALAIILVFFFHYQLFMFGHPEWVTTYARFGWTGVDLFFVLSGFLISSQLFTALKAGKGISYRQFFLKRFFRIVPAYWTVVALYFCFPLFREREALPALWRFLSFTQNLGLNIKSHGTFSHAWSLCVEEHFYFAFPLILICLSRWKLLKAGAWLIAGLFVAVLVLRGYSWLHFYEPYINDNGAGIRWQTYIYYPTYNRLDGLLVGISIAAIYVFAPALWSRISRYGNALFAISLLILVAAYFEYSDEHSLGTSIFGFLLVAIGYGAMVMAAISPSCFLYQWKSRITTLIATLSYGVYLCHKAVIHMTQLAAEKLGLDRDSNGVLLLCIVACLLFAGGLYLLVEKPFMRLKDRMTGRSRKKITESVSVKN